MELLALLLKDYKLYLAVLVAVFVSATSYTFAYMASFGISSIFSYLTFSNIIFFTAVPISILILIFLLIVLVILSLLPLIKSFSTKVIPNPRKTFDIILAFLIGIIVISFLGCWFDLDYRIVILGGPLLVGGIIYICLRYPKETEKYLIIGLVIILPPFLSYYFGYKDASRILNNEKYLFTPIKMAEGEKRFKLIGFINGRYFLTDEENKRILIVVDKPQMYFEKFVKKDLANKS